MTFNVRDWLYVILAVTQLLGTIAALIAGAKILAHRLAALEARFEKLEREFVRKDTVDAWHSDFQHQLDAMKEYCRGRSHLSSP